MSDGAVNKLCEVNERGGNQGSTELLPKGIRVCCNTGGLWKAEADMGWFGNRLGGVSEGRGMEGSCRAALVAIRGLKVP